MFRTGGSQVDRAAGGDRAVGYRDLYEGHLLNAWTAQVAGGWTWCYTVDDGAMVESGGQPNMPESMVLDEGIGQARRAVRENPGLAVKGESSQPSAHSAAGP
jgi:hypothetical protein